MFHRFKFIYVFIKFIFLFSLYTNSTYGFETVKDINIPELLEINFKKKALKEYIFNLYKAKISLASSSSIKDRYKKWHPIQIRINNEKNEGTFFNGKARVTGDSYRHIDIQNLNSSLKIKLKRDNISGITTFRLILPKAIGNDVNDDGKNEILWSILMEFLGYPTLYKAIIKVKLNEKIYDAYFEEGFEKEFIERWGFREAPILKGDERQFWYNRNQNLKETDAVNFIIQNRKFLKNHTSLKILMNGIDSNQYYRLNEFYSLNSFFAKHGITINNRRFLFDPIRNFKIPIYYDGEVKLSTLPPKWKFDRHKKINCDATLKLFKSNFRNNIYLNKINFEYKKRSFTKLNKLQKCIVKFIINHRSSWSKNEVQVLERRDYKKSEHGDYWNLNRKFRGTGKNINTKDLKANFSLIEQPEIIKYRNNEFYSCNQEVATNDCQKLDFLQARKYLIGKSKPKILKDLSKAFPFIMHNNKNQKTPNLINIFEKNKNIVLKNDTLTLIKLNENLEQLNVYNNNFNSRLILTGNTSKKFKLFVKKVSNLKISNSPIRYDEHLLTGCVTFIDTKFNGGKISIEQKNCEDSINIISSKGQIDEIKVENAKFDAIDLDFSDIKIKLINVENAGNDCVDVSSGTYNFDKTSVTNCGDKAVSVGENSRALINNLINNNSKTGLASKDSSITYVKNYNVDQKSNKGTTNYCISAYRKKQEFYGGYVYYNNTNCESFFNDEVSVIKKTNDINCDEIILHDKNNFCLNKKQLKSFDFNCSQVNRKYFEYGFFNADFKKINILNYIQQKNDYKNSASCINKLNLKKFEGKNLYIFSKDLNGKLLAYSLIELNHEK